MRIVLSAAISADGYLDNSADERLVLSSPEDWQAVYALRAECDAILVGAETLRKDNPALVAGNPDIIKVVVSRSGELDPQSKFFTQGDGEKIVLSGDTFTAEDIVARLRKRGIETLMVEGGSTVLSMFLREKIWDEFRLAVAPVFVADGRATRLVQDGEYPPMRLEKVEQAGQMAVMHYVNTSPRRIDNRKLERALENSLHAPKIAERYRVGAVVVTADGREFDGYTGETDAASHAEEVAIGKALAAGADLVGATIYSTMEPCTQRKSRPESCTDLIIRHGLRRVVFALREPCDLAVCNGVDRLSEAGTEVSEIPAYASDVIDINSHIIG